MEPQEQVTESPPPPAPPSQLVLADPDKVAVESEDNGLVKTEPLTTETAVSVMTADDCCDTNPEFAVICSFIIQFGEKIELDLDIGQLKSSIENLDYVDESLIDLHVRLLKKVRRYFVRDQWEKALIKFATGYSYQDAYEIESQGYLKTRPSVRLELLRRLLEAQFECDQKFKAAVNLCEATELRLLPTGRDIKGNTYWQRTDKEGNLRIFLEEPLDYRSWRAACTNADELNHLIEELDRTKEEKVKGDPRNEPYNPLPEIFPEYFIKEEKVQKENDPAKKVVKTKKGARGKNKAKKSLPTLKEVEEEEASNTLIQKSEAVDPIPLTNGHSNEEFKTQLNSPSSPISTEESSIESQVSSILENLICKVVFNFNNLNERSTENSNSAQVSEEKPAEAKPKKKPTRREKVKEEVLPRRSSSRIQQLQMKKIAEQQEELKKIVESSAQKDSTSISSSLDSNSTNRVARDNNIRPESPNQGSRNGKKRRKRGSWRRGKGKKKLSWDKDDSDLSSTSSITESEEEEEDIDETFNIEPNDYDDEFACEDEETSQEPVIVKRARTARQSIGFNEQGNLENSSVIEEDKPCERCDKSDNPEWILLCDMCDDGYHTSCCLPPLMVVPDGDWFCPPCEHKMLLTKLRELHASIVEILETKERERKKRQRLRPIIIKKEQICEVAQEAEPPKKRQRCFLNELNDPIALQALDNEIDASSYIQSDESQEERKPIKKKKTKRPAKRRRGDRDSDFKLSRKTYSRLDLSNSDEATETETESESEHQSGSSEDELVPKVRRARASVSYRFQEYDDLIQSAIRGDSDEEYVRRESPEERCGYGRGKDMASIEALAYQQENGMLDGEGGTEASGKVMPRRKPRKKARRLNDLDADSETEGATSDESFQASATEAEEEDDDDDLTAVDSESYTETSIDELVGDFHPKKKAQKKSRKRAQSYDSEDSEYQPSRTRRAASKKISYKESTDDEDTDTQEPVHELEPAREPEQVLEPEQHQDQILDPDQHKGLHQDLHQELDQGFNQRRNQDQEKEKEEIAVKSDLEITLFR